MKGTCGVWGANWSTSVSQLPTGVCSPHCGAMSGFPHSRPKLLLLYTWTREMKNKPISELLFWGSGVRPGHWHQASRWCSQHGASQYWPEGASGRGWGFWGSTIGKQSQSLPSLMSLEHCWTTNPQSWICYSISQFGDFCSAIGSSSALGSSSYAEQNFSQGGGIQEMLAKKNWCGETPDMGRTGICSHWTLSLIPTCLEFISTPLQSASIGVRMVQPVSRDALRLCSPRAP